MEWDCTDTICVDLHLAGCVDADGNAYDDSVPVEMRAFYNERRSDHYFPVSSHRPKPGVVRRREPRDLIECIVKRASDDTVPIYKGFGPQTDDDDGVEPVRVVLRGNAPRRETLLEGPCEFARVVSVVVEATESDYVDKLLDDIRAELYVSGRLEDFEEEELDIEEFLALRADRHYGLIQPVVSI